MTMPVYMVPCDVVRTFLMDYLDGQQPLLRRWRFWFHLLLCPPCSRYLRQYKTSIQFAEDLAQERKPPPEFLEHTREFLRKHMDLQEK